MALKSLVKSLVLFCYEGHRASSCSSLTSVDVVPGLVAGTPVQLVNNIELLGVTLDTKLTMWDLTKRDS